MLNINITTFRKNIFNILEQTIKFNEPVNVSTKDGNAVIISEDDYNDIMATVETYNTPNLHSELLQSKESPENDWISEDEVNW